MISLRKLLEAALGLGQPSVGGSFQKKVGDVDPDISKLKDILFSDDEVNKKTVKDRK